MTPKFVRLLMLFLAGFVLLSLIPYAPAAAARLQALPLHVDLTGDAALGTAAGLAGLLLLLRLRRRTPAPARSTAVARRKPGRAAPAAPAGLPMSALRARIRAAAGGGTRVPAVARELGLSVDAVRAALGRDQSAPAARPGRTFRPRQPSLPARPRATPVASGRKPYTALA